MKQKNAEKLVRHPVRVQIAALLVDRKMSPSELAEEVGTTLGTAAYHVRTMDKMGAIRLTNEARVRGAIEHFYTLRKSAREPIKKALLKASKQRAEAEEVFTQF